VSEKSQPKGPPFDGGAPCPMCPVEIRGLAATAHNLVVTFEAWRSAKGPGADEQIAMWKQMERLAEAVKLAQPFLDAHFADRMHSHGEVNR